MKKILVAAAVIGCVALLGVALGIAWKSTQRDLADFRAMREYSEDCMKLALIAQTAEIESRTSDMLAVRLGYRFEATSQAVGPYGIPVDERKGEAETLVRRAFHHALVRIKSSDLPGTFSRNDSREGFEKAVLTSVKDSSFSRLIGSDLRIAWVAYEKNGEAVLIENPRVQDGPPAPKVPLALGAADRVR